MDTPFKITLLSRVIAFNLPRRGNQNQEVRQCLRGFLRSIHSDIQVVRECVLIQSKSLTPPVQYVSYPESHDEDALGYKLI